MGPFIDKCGSTVWEDFRDRWCAGVLDVCGELSPCFRIVGLDRGDP